MFRALLLGVEEAVARTRKTWKAASTDMAQYREKYFICLVQDTNISYSSCNMIYCG